MNLPLDCLGSGCECNDHSVDLTFILYLSAGPRLKLIEGLPEKCRLLLVVDNHLLDASFIHLERLDRRKFRIRLFPAVIFLRLEYVRAARLDSFCRRVVIFHGEYHGLALSILQVMNIEHGTIVLYMLHEFDLHILVLYCLVAGEGGFTCRSFGSILYTLYFEIGETVGRYFS